MRAFFRTSPRAWIVLFIFFNSGIFVLTVGFLIGNNLFFVGTESLAWTVCFFAVGFGIGSIYIFVGTESLVWAVFFFIVGFGIGTTCFLPVIHLSREPCFELVIGNTFCC